MQPLSHSPISRIMERTRKKKVKKLMGWDKDRLIRKAKASHTSKAKQGIFPAFPMGRQMFSHPQESRARSHIIVTWENKCHRSKHSSFLSSSLHFVYWAWYHRVWNIPLDSWDHLFWLCLLPGSYGPPASLQAWQFKWQKRLWLCSSPV